MQKSCMATMEGLMVVGKRVKPVYLRSEIQF